MSGLVLKLGPRERIAINGVVAENGDRRARLNDADAGRYVLRLRDASIPTRSTRRSSGFCYIAQLVLAGEGGSEKPGGSCCAGSSSSARFSGTVTAAANWPMRPKP